MIYELLIIGGGAAGIMAAMAVAMAAESADVLLLEKNDRVGKKLLVTGNGRCNLTNQNISLSNYHGANVYFAEYALKKFGAAETIAFFERLGLVCLTEENHVYPLCGQAGAVLDVCRHELMRFAVAIRQAKVKMIFFNKGVFNVIGEGSETFLAKKVIVATGGIGGDGYSLLESFGHSVTPIYPALTQLKSNSKWIKPLKGIRVKAAVNLYIENKFIANRVGELLFTAYGISGICVMDLSGYVARQLNAQAAVKIDLAPSFSESDLMAFLIARAKNLSHLSMDKFLIGFFHRLIGEMLFKYANIAPPLCVASVTKAQIKTLTNAIKNLEIPITGTTGHANAQVTGGGIRTDEFDPTTMESKKQKGLYAAGETLDIYGDCGGYNLQWAWSSGYLAGYAAIRNSHISKH